MKMAIVGVGEVGRTYADSLLTQGAHELELVDPRPSAAALELSLRTGHTVRAAPGTWLGAVDRVWLCVPGEVTRQVAETIAPFISADTVVIDLTSASPPDKRAIDATYTSRGLFYVDAVIMGAIGMTGVNTPILSVGAQAAAALLELEAIGAPVRVLPGARAGDAATLKVLRTVLTKGLEALAIECLIAAEQLGLRTELYEVFADVDAAGLTQTLDVLVKTHVLHAQRRGREVARAETQLDELGLSSLLMGACEQRFALTARALVDDPPPTGTADHIDTAVAWLLGATKAQLTAAT